MAVAHQKIQKYVAIKMWDVFFAGNLFEVHEVGVLGLNQGSQSRAFSAPKA